MAVQIQFRRGTASQWSTANPQLAAGELGLETDTGKFKVGDGSTYWNTLAYSSGPAGAAGPTGATGPQGAAGADGADGSDGAAGPTGATGPQGAAGADGADGSDGAAGPTGATGPQGAAGADGADGSDGAAGPTGATGPQGAAGADGADGSDGAAGPTGATGPQGAAGADGADGSDGAAGPTGATGPQGDDGIEASATAPTDTDVLWLDTSTTGSAALSQAGLETYLNGNLGTAIIPDTNDAYDIGSAEYKIRDLYLSANSLYLGDAHIRSEGQKVIAPEIQSGDLHLTNGTGAPNSVDGTRGNYTIQEGREHLFLINNLTGKKYRFNLTEIVE
jgi:hypothetical protein